MTTDGTGTAVTPNPLRVGDLAFGGTAAVDLSVEPTAIGAILWREGQNLLNGWHYLPPPESRPVISPLARLGIRLEVAPAVSKNFTVIAVIEEIGG